MGWLTRIFGVKRPRLDHRVPFDRSSILMPDDLGPFAVMFDGQSTSYLQFLHMGPGAPAALTTLSTVLRSSDETRHYVERMLQSDQWRPHLVACAAVLLSGDHASYAAALWRTFDHGSWVAPQLAATLYLTDPEFIREVKRRVTERCNPAGATDQESKARVAKDVASLTGVLRSVATEAEWLASELAQPDIRALLKSDCDHSDVIATEWLEAVRAHSAFFVRT